MRSVHESANVAGLVAGFPCTDIAVAGNRQGLDGDHRKLVLHVLRLCDEPQCDFIFLESVDYVHSMGDVWKRSLSELTQRDFAVRWVTVACSQIGAPQRGWRWFLYGCRGRCRDTEFADPIVAASPCLASGRDFNPSGRPPPSQWLTKAPYGACVAQLSLLGNAVVPLQGFTAA